MFDMVFFDVFFILCFHKIVKKEKSRKWIATPTARNDRNRRYRIKCGMTGKENDTVGAYGIRPQKTKKCKKGIRPQKNKKTKKM